MFFFCFLLNWLFLYRTNPSILLQRAASPTMMHAMKWKRKNETNKKSMNGFLCVCVKNDFHHFVVWNADLTWNKWISSEMYLLAIFFSFWLLRFLLCMKFLLAAHFVYALRSFELVRLRFLLWKHRLVWSAKSVSFVNFLTPLHEQHDFWYAKSFKCLARSDNVLKSTQQIQHWVSVRRFLCLFS